jgi:hypothetical protein
MLQHVRFLLELSLAQHDMQSLILDLLAHGQFLPVSLRFRISQSVEVVAEVVRDKLQTLPILVVVAEAREESCSPLHFQLPVVHQ